MKVKEIQDILSFISKSGLEEVNIETDTLKLKVRKSGSSSNKSVVQEVITQAIPPVIQAAPAPVAQSDDSPAEKPNKTADKVELRSPMIGTFYRSPNPQSPPFVKIGDRVEKGDPICIVEAMKLFNEIEAEASGVIADILVEDKSPVEFEQPLFLIEPH